jgi:hypothetical protein
MDSSDEHYESVIPQQSSASGAEPPARAPEADSTEAGDAESRTNYATGERSAISNEGGTPEPGAARTATAVPSKETVATDEQLLTTPVSLKKIEASRRNGEKSQGPKTEQGKQHSSWNSTKHGLLGKRLLARDGASKPEWEHLLGSLRQDIEPVGALEELLVEKIAKSYWRLQLADGFELDMSNSWTRFFGSMDKMARYQTAIGRQLARDVADLKRLQRERREMDAAANDAAAGEEVKEG